jgi:hypothetical protein
MKMYFQDCSRNLYFTAQLRFTKLRKNYKSEFVYIIQVHMHSTCKNYCTTRISKFKSNQKINIYLNWVLQFFKQFLDSCATSPRCPEKLASMANQNLFSKMLKPWIIHSYLKFKRPATYSVSAVRSLQLQSLQ